MKFAGTIKRYAKKRKLIKKSAEDVKDSGEIESGGTTKYEITAAITQFSAKEISRGGAELGYTTQDIKVFVAAPVEAENLEAGETEQIELQEGDIIVYKDRRYYLDNENDRTEHADFIKWIAVLDQQHGQVNEND